MMEPEDVSTLHHASPDRLQHGELSENSDEDEWQSKLISLQDQHKLESHQQQQEHLEQLKHLQSQLLRELSSDMSLEGALSTEGFRKTKQATTPLKVIDHEVSSETGTLMSPEKQISTTESLGILTPTQSTEFLPLTRTSTVVKDSPRSGSHTPQRSPEKRFSDPQTPVYKLLGPKSAWEGGSISHSPHRPLVTRSPQRMNNSPQTSVRTNPHGTMGGGTFRTPQSTRGSGTPLSTTRGDTLSKASLVAKHTRHVEDLKKYYESELLTLRRQLEQVRPGSVVGSPFRASGPSSPAQRQLKFTSGEVPRPVKDSMVESELWILQSENDRLKNTCSELHAQFDDTEREKHVLEGQLKRVQQHASEWQERCEATERMVSVLQERLDSSRGQLQEQGRLNGQLTSDLKMTTDELMFWKDQKLQDVDKLDQLFHEFEVLQEENQQLLSLNSDLKAKLEDSGGESMTLRNSLDKYQILEAQYKSTIRRLEDEVRHLEHVNNRLHSQATHYDTGWHNDPVTSQHSHMTRSPQADLSRQTHHTQNPIHTKSNQSPVPIPETHKSDKSPGQVLGTPHSASKPLTRRKWLESSIPGLLFGGEPEPTEKIPTSNSRVASQISPEATAKRSVKQSPRKESGNKGDERAPTHYKGDERAPTHYKGDERTPTHYDASVDDTLRAIRDGSVVTSGEGKRKSKKKNEQSLEQRVREQMERVGQAERRLAELQTEKERLESALQRTPRSGGRVTRETKQSQLDLERRLEQVMKEIGSVRMVLRKHHAFKR